MRYPGGRFASALPARGASAADHGGDSAGALCLGAACTGCIRSRTSPYRRKKRFASALPARGASGGTLAVIGGLVLCLGAACTGCIRPYPSRPASVLRFASALPARGASVIAITVSPSKPFASALPARGASSRAVRIYQRGKLCLGAACMGCIFAPRGGGEAGNLCLGAACTGCIFTRRRERMFAAYLCLGAACTGCILPSPRPSPLPCSFASALPARGASRMVSPPFRFPGALPRRCLHGVHPVAVSIVIVHCPLCLGAACTGCIQPRDQHGLSG